MVMILCKMKWHLNFFSPARFLRFIHSSDNNIGIVHCHGVMVGECFTNSCTGLNNIHILFSHSPFRDQVVNICNLDFIIK
jgi:hypothetical protein